MDPSECLEKGLAAYRRGNFKKAFAMLSTETLIDDPTAQYLLGRMYYDGKGTRQSYELAIHLYKGAASKDCAAAMKSLGWMYEFGKGVPQSYEDAVRWYRRGPSSATPPAKVIWATCTSTGRA
ncbi:tetratricopeptide repeat protein [Methanomethylophilus alvi]|uniref:tetratricopeptide repeat protein n=1 Tax=Methanomethylophilus alvi TaxID=1291540 RepID=UPI0037DC801C